MKEGKDFEINEKLPFKLDDIDGKIIRILEENGRTPNNEIASRVEVSEGTIRNRILKLIKNGLMRITALINPSFVVDRQLIYLGIKVALNKDTIKTAEAIIKLPYVKSAAIVTGRFDLLVEIFIPSSRLINFLTQDMARTGTIVNVESFVTLKSFNKWI